MCIAFDGAYILEAPAADPDSTDGHRTAAEIAPAAAGGSGRPQSLRPASPPPVMPDPVLEVSATLKRAPRKGESLT
jgi:hypothetical protein